MSKNITSLIFSLFILATVVIIIGNTFGIYLWYFHPSHPMTERVIDLFDLNLASNIPTFFISFLLLFASALLFRIAFKKRDQFVYWLGLACGFFILTCFKALHIHKIFWWLSRELRHSYNIGLWFWAALFGGGLLVLAMIYIPFLRQLPKESSKWMAAAAGVWVTGAIVVDKIAGIQRGLDGPDLTYKLLYTIEESMEMIGVLIFIYALFRLLDPTFKWVFLNQRNKKVKVSRF